MSVQEVGSDVVAVAAVAVGGAYVALSRGSGAGAVEFCADRIGNPAAERMARIGQDDDGGF